MVVKLITRMASPEGNYPPGFVIALDAKQAQALIDGGYAIKDGDDNGNVLHNNRGKSGTREKG